MERHNPHAMFLGRTVRPTALGLTVIATALGVGSFMGQSLLKGQAFGQTVAALCALAAVSYIAGWVFRRQRLARLGDLLVFFTFATQTAFLWLEGGDGFLYRMVTLAPGTISVWVGVGLMSIAGGAFWFNGQLE